MSMRHVNDLLLPGGVERLLDDSELTSDLLALLEELDAGWASPFTELGIGGCLFVAMGRVIENNGKNDRAIRVSGMATAMGFGSGKSPDLPALWKWNDAQSDVEAVKDRVQLALSRGSIICC